MRVRAVTVAAVVVLAGGVAGGAFATAAPSGRSSDDHRFGGRHAYRVAWTNQIPGGMPVEAATVSPVASSCTLTQAAATSLSQVKSSKVASVCAPDNQVSLIPPPSVSTIKTWGGAAAQTPLPDWCAGAQTAYDGWVYNRFDSCLSGVILVQAWNQTNVLATAELRYDDHVYGSADEPAPDWFDTKTLTFITGTGDWENLSISLDMTCTSCTMTGGPPPTIFGPGQILVGDTVGGYEIQLQMNAPPNSVEVTGNVSHSFLNSSFQFLVPRRAQHAERHRG